MFTLRLRGLSLWFALGLAVLTTSQLPAQQGPIEWLTPEVTEQQLPGETTYRASFRSSTFLANVTLRLAPSADEFMSARFFGPQSEMINVEANTIYQVTLVLQGELALLPHSIGGTVHLVAGGKVLPNPLVIRIRRPGDTASTRSGQENETICSRLSWEADGLEQGLLGPGEATVTLHSSCNLRNAVFWFTPSLQPFLEVISPAAPTNILPGQSYAVTLRRRVAAGQLPGDLAGTLHARSSSSGSQRTYPLPLPINLSGVEQMEAVPDVVTSAASYQAGFVAPGQMVTVFGQGIGPAQIAHFQLNAQGEFGDTLANTMVFFDGLPARLVFVRSDQVGAIVPFSVGGQTSSEMVVTYRGKTSASFLVPIAPRVPGIFTQDASGQGPSAVLNIKPPDFTLTLNTFQNRAFRNQPVAIYITGAGLLQGASTADGQIVQDDKTVIPMSSLVQVQIGGRFADVIYAGGSPGLVNSIIQINAIVPPSAPQGLVVPVLVTIDGVTSPAGTTMSVL